MTDISNNNYRIARNTFFLYIRMLFVMIVTLYTSRVVLTVLGIQDFGIYSVVGGVVSVIGVLKGAMSAATTRFLTFELGRENKGEFSKVFCCSIILYVAICVVFVVLSETIGLWFLNNCLIIPENRIDAANWVFHFTIIAVAVEIMSIPYNAVIISYEKMSFYAYISIAEVIMRLLILYLLFLFPFDQLAVYGFLTMCVSLIVRFSYQIYCKLNFSECSFSVCRDILLYKRLVSYSGWNLFGSLSSLAEGHGSNIILNMFFLPSVSAARGISNQIYHGVSQFSENFYTAVRPQIIKYYAKADMNEMFKLIFRSGRMSFYLDLILCVPVLLETTSIVSLWLGQTPEYVVAFSRLVIIIALINATARPVMTSIHATGHVSWYQFLVGTLTIMNIPISFFFLKYGWPPIIVLYVSLFITILSLGVRLIILKKYIPQFPVFMYLVRVVGTCLLVLLLSCLIPLFVKYCLSLSYYEMPIVIVLSIISVASVVFLVGLKNEERNYVVNTIRKKIQNEGSSRNGI